MTLFSKSCVLFVTIPKNLKCSHDPRISARRTHDKTCPSFRLMSSTKVVPKEEEEDCWLLEFEGEGEGVTDDVNPLKSS